MALSLGLCLDLLSGKAFLYLPGYGLLMGLVAGYSRTILGLRLALGIPLLGAICCLPIRTACCVDIPVVISYYSSAVNIGNAFVLGILGLLVFFLLLLLDPDSSFVQILALLVSFTLTISGNTVLIGSAALIFLATFLFALPLGFLACFFFSGLRFLGLFVFALSGLLRPSGVTCFVHSQFLLLRISV